MKDMGRCGGHVAFCAILLFYCSIITASSPHLSVKRKDGVPEVNMTSVLQTTEMDFSNQTQPSVNSTEPTAHTDNRTAASSPHLSVKRKDGVPEVNMTSVLQTTEMDFSNQTQPSVNSTEPTAHTDNRTAETVVNSTTPIEENSENTTDSQNTSDVSHVQNQTATTTIILTTILPPTTHKSTTSSESRADSSSTATQSTQTSTSSSNSSSPIQARTHMDTPSALNVGDKDSNKVSTDPLLAGLVSAFVVVAAIMLVLVFLKFRNANNGPRFRRLQDLPMDDMLEDAPLSMYSY